LFKEDEHKVQDLGRMAATTLRVYGLMCKRPLLKLNEICRQTEMSFSGAAKCMEALVRLGIAREITGAQRNRIFCYGRYLAILSEGAEPL
jgi:hypothetical protein